ncbi:MAG TPA: metalloregulator ArsR/SmtB family transcription factor [Candidatus Bathyarchaeia archaeon]|jgi:DNA-binding transcriptional ArsR family regulator|nr:metalloregulator ArsR/SmtB family transcription factor [Candidatus Bathyarchaeia archaeon]
MKAIKTITDPEAFKLMGDETRRKIIFLLRAKEMTVSQIAEELELTPQAVYHHIKKLTEGGLVEVTREVRVEHLIESYYRATAESFNFMLGKTSRSENAVKEQTATALNALKKLGFKIEFDDKTVAKLTNLQLELDDCCKITAYEDKITEMENIDLLTKIRIEEFASIISMTDEEFANEVKINRKLMELLRSLVKKGKS